MEVAASLYQRRDIREGGRRNEKVVKGEMPKDGVTLCTWRTFFWRLILSESLISLPDNWTGEI
jgi:hypothetical protein